ncbi:hypothetical protein YC2023_117229 [Brassica napus]
MSDAGAGSSQGRGSQGVGQQVDPGRKWAKRLLCSAMALGANLQRHCFMSQHAFSNQCNYEINSTTYALSRFSGRVARTMKTNFKLAINRMTTPAVSQDSV